MYRKLWIVVALLAIAAGFAVAQDLTIDYQFNTARNVNDNYFSYKGPITYVTADKDTFDATSGASKFGSTHVFQPYRVDVLGKNVLPDALRDLFLYPIAPAEQRTVDALDVSKDRNGVITIQFAHRGTAYRLVTDAQGRLTLPNAQAQKRKIGFIVGAGPQVISKDFSNNGTADRVDYKKVWDSSIAAGTQIDPSRADVTGAITTDGAASDSMFYWSGTLQVTFDRNVLKIQGGLNAVKR